VPYTTPALVTIAVDGRSLLQMPPATLSDNDVVLPWQTNGRPVMTPGAMVVITVTLVDAATVPQLFVARYNMLVVPVVTAETSPVLLIEAIPGALLLHTPPEAVSLNETWEPTHRFVVPVMGLKTGNWSIVTITDTGAVPQLLETE
jgi:hypothetical protein